MKRIDNPNQTPPDGVIDFATEAQAKAYLQGVRDALTQVQESLANLNVRVMGQKYKEKKGQMDGK